MSEKRRPNAKGGSGDRDHSFSSKAGGNQQPNMAFISATAGALAGAVARVVVGPLDVIKIRFQVQLEPILARAQASKYTSVRQAVTTIVKEEGIQGLWRGTVPGLLLTIPYTAVQFLALQQCRRAADERGVTRATFPALSFVTGGMAGAAGTVASYPFDLLRTTLAAQGEPRVYANMVDAARGILGHAGVRGLYRGLGVTLLEIVPYAALQFGLYDALNSAADKARRATLRPGEALPPPSSLQAFLCGLAAGTAAKMGTHPLDVAKKRFQVAGLQRSARYGERVAEASVRSLSGCLREILAKEGLGGFYKGALPSIVKAAPAAAVTFACYDFFMRALLAQAAADSAAEVPRRPPGH